MNEASRTSLVNFSKIKKIGFLGFGPSNIGAYEFIKRKYPKISFTLRDEKIRGSLPPFFHRCYTGADALHYIDEDMLILSPSVRRDRPELIRAKKNGVILYSDLEIFFSRYNGAAFGVTGSDGKSTTTFLLTRLLREADINAKACGNFGLSPCALLDSDAIPVIELSSFQLSFISPRLTTAVITGISENHLDWHRDYDEYKEAKLAILKDASSVVFDYDSKELREHIISKDVTSVISLNKKYSELCKQLLAKYYLTVENGAFSINGEPFLSISDLKRKEEYNIRNMLLALGAACPYTTPGAASEIFRKFTGLAHRAETVLEDGGIKYVDSSIDTSPARANKTISEMRGRCFVILGGKSKGLPCDELLQILPERTLGAALLGPLGEELYSLLSNDSRFKNYRFCIARNMEEAIMLGREILGSDGTILLCPGGTSYDAYASFEERGKDFLRAAQTLKKI